MVTQAGLGLAAVTPIPSLLLTKSVHRLAVDDGSKRVDSGTDREKMSYNG